MTIEQDKEKHFVFYDPGDETEKPFLDIIYFYGTDEEIAQLRINLIESWIIAGMDIQFAYEGYSKNEAKKALKKKLALCLVLLW